MNELIDKINNLKNELNNTKEVQEIISINRLISQDKDLLDKINKYNLTKDERIKEEILKNKLFKEYKDKEIDLNILIMQINSELKKINSKGSCSL